MPTIYQVGGCVRDKLLGIKPKDYDFVFVSDVSDISGAFTEMMTYLQRKGFTIFLSTSDCFTIRAKFPPTHEFKHMTADFVLARKELHYTDNSRKPVCIPGTLYDDLERRDFTVNAMAEDESGHLIDYFNGVHDLRAGILRTPIDPQRSFGDDPLRLLRAMRFAITKDFTFSSEVDAAFATPQLWNKLKTTVSKERIREELHKCFAHNSIKSIRYLQKLDQIDSTILDSILHEPIWLKPTMEKRK
jgi:poly(A) polymerase